MALFDFTITDQNVGELIGPQAGYLVNLAMTTPPARLEIPSWDPGRQRWVSAYLVLRGQHDIRDLVCCNPSIDAGSFQWWGSEGRLLTNSSLFYRGTLVIVCVPRGSVWAVSLSDIPIAPLPRTNSDGANFGSYPDYRHGVGRPILPLDRRPERERVLR